jgi:hypothetical protein
MSVLRAAKPDERIALLGAHVLIGLSASGRDAVEAAT